MYIDVHCHLNLIKEVSASVKKAEKDGVSIIITQGVDVKTNREALNLSNEFKIVKCALGLYPSDILKMTDSKINEELDFIKKNKNKLIAIGEIGLDKTYKDFEKQKKIFIELLQLAKEIDKPVIINSRKAEEETIKILEQEKMKKVIMHCFCGSKELVKRVIKNGWYISIPANVTFSKQFQENIALTPIEQLFCETDSPFLHPEKGKRNNTPTNVIESYKKIAEIKMIDLETVTMKIEQNFKRVFRV